jgi:hypothetical protein
MKNWWTRLGCLLTGWNFDILNTCTEASRKQLKKFSSALLILIILWGLIGYLFADRYVGLSWKGCSIAAIAMIVIVLQIERQIILTVGKNLWLASFRIVIALIMAIIGSTILDQIIFKDDIEKKMIEIVDRQVREQLPNRLTIINTKLQDIQIEIDSLDIKNLELYAEISRRPTIETVSTVRTPMTIRQPDGTDSIVYRTAISKSPIANPKVREAETNNEHLDELRKQQNEYTQRKLDAENSLRQELKSKQGFLEELNAIIEILKERPVALGFYLILFLFLMSLELFVVFSKIGDKKSDYDLVVEHQLEQKKKMIDNLKDNKSNKETQERG